MDELGRQVLTYLPMLAEKASEAMLRPSATNLSICGSYCARSGCTVLVYSEMAPFDCGCHSQITKISLAS